MPTRTAAPRPHVGFEELPFEQAVNYFESLEVVPTTSYRDLHATERRRAFTVAKLTQIDLLEDVHRHVGDSIETGESLKEFIDTLSDKLNTSGWGGVGPPGSELGTSTRLENIYRTNLATIYSAGEWDQMQESAAARAARGVRTLLTLNAVGDERTREEHQDLDGTTLPIDDPFWDENSPPLDYQCRCWLTEETDESASETDAPDVHEDAVGEGFGGRNWDASTQDELEARIAETWPALGEAMRASMGSSGFDEDEEG